MIWEIDTQLKIAMQPSRFAITSIANNTPRIAGGKAVNRMGLRRVVFGKLVFLSFKVQNTVRKPIGKGKQYGDTRTGRHRIGLPFRRAVEQISPLLSPFQAIETMSRPDVNFRSPIIAKEPVDITGFAAGSALLGFDMVFHGCNP
jgi:hypothetical protein